MVISIEPLLIAAYSTELDCVAMLHFPSSYVNEYGLKLRSRLLTINTYFTRPPYQNDLIIGEMSLNNWYGVNPMIAEFITDDMDRIKERKDQIDESLWNRVLKLGNEYRTKHNNIWRDGRPIHSKKSAL